MQKLESKDWPVLPMEPKSAPCVTDSADMLYQIKWDGVRVLSYKFSNGSIRLFNRRLNERTAQYPEICEALDAIMPGTVLDGEIIALDQNGRPDFPRVLRRDLVRSPQKIKAAMAAVSVHYMVFDVLWLDGDAVYSWPLAKRLALLTGMDIKEGLIRLVDSVPAAGRALFDAAQAEGLEGIVAKKADSAYMIGKKTDAWQKIKCLRKVTAIVGGYLADGQRVRSLLFGLPDGDRLQYIGAAASGVTQAQWQNLRQLFAKMPGPCPFVNPPVLSDAHWVMPLLHAHIRFLEYTSGGVMRAPVITGFSEAL